MKIRYYWRKILFANVFLDSANRLVAECALVKNALTNVLWRNGRIPNNYINLYAQSSAQNRFIRRNILSYMIKATASKFNISNCIYNILPNEQIVQHPAFFFFCSSIGGQKKLAYPHGKKTPGYVPMYK